MREEQCVKIRIGASRQYSARHWLFKDTCLPKPCPQGEAAGGRSSCDMLCTWGHCSIPVSTGGSGDWWTATGSTGGSIRPAAHGSSAGNRCSSTPWVAEWWATGIRAKDWECISGDQSQGKAATWGGGCTETERVERWGATKSMLRKAAIEEGKDWDKMLPYLLFEYREVPHASTGFSPFELLYGHAVNGPLDVLKQTWEASQRSDESVVSHVLSMKTRWWRWQIWFSRIWVRPRRSRSFGMTRELASKNSQLEIKYWFYFLHPPANSWLNGKVPMKCWNV